MYRSELVYFVALSLVILLTQFAPTSLLLMLDSIVVRACIVLLLLYLVHIGPTAGIFGLMAVALLYLERNRRKIGMAVQKIDMMDSHFLPQATVEEEGKPQQTVPVNGFDAPVPDVSDYLPHEDCESGKFEPVAPTINEKAVLSTVYPLETASGSASASDVLYESLGFGHIRGLQTVGDN